MPLTCPSTDCRTENPPDSSQCSNCGLPLRNYAQLLAHGNALFNRGLCAARDGRLRQARDLFAAVVYWCPFDWEARNALAAACFELNDLPEARRHWQHVLDNSPKDPRAAAGLASIESVESQRKGFRKQRQRKAKRNRR